MMQPTITVTAIRLKCTKLALHTKHHISASSSVCLCRAVAVNDDCSGGTHPTGSGRGGSSDRTPFDVSPVAAAAVDLRQQQQPAWPPVVYDRGYVASPNYPGKYYLDTDCRWRLVVQRQQTIRITLYDFELDVKRAGRCHEFLEIIALAPSSSGSAAGTGNDVISSGGGVVGGSGRVYFRDCGSLGKQMLTVESSEALVRFKTGQASLAQRGFLLYFEGA